MRKYSAALATEFAKTITSVGYFVQLDFTNRQRWSTMGRVLWPSVPMAGTYAVVSNVCTVTFAAHGIPVGASVYCDFTTGGAAALDGDFVLTASAGGTFTFALVTANTSGNVSFNPVWNAIDFTIEGLTFDADQEQSARLTVPNLDGVASALFMGSDKLYNTPVTVYQFELDALAGAGDANGPDVPKIATLAITGANIGLDVVALGLTGSKADSGFAPRRRVCPSDGFKFALPPGHVIAWDGKIGTLEEAS